MNGTSQHAITDRTEPAHLQVSDKVLQPTPSNSAGSGILSLRCMTRAVPVEAVFVQVRLQLVRSLEIEACCWKCACAIILVSVCRCKIIGVNYLKLNFKSFRFTDARL